MLVEVFREVAAQPSDNEADLKRRRSEAEEADDELAVAELTNRIMALKKRRAWSGPTISISNALTARGRTYTAEPAFARAAGCVYRNGPLARLKSCAPETCLHAR